MNEGGSRPLNGLVRRLSAAEPRAEVRYVSRDEFVAHQKEFKRQLSEVFDLARERAEAEAQTARACQLLDSRIDRCMRQTQDFEIRQESVQERLESQVEFGDSWKRSADGLRDELQDAKKALASSLDELQAAAMDAVEQRCAAVADSARKRERTMADELLRKMSELNEKLGSNMVTLEDEVAAEVRDLRARLEEELRRTASGATSQAKEVEGRLLSKTREMVEHAVKGNEARTIGRSGDALQAVADLKARVDSALDAAQAEQVSRQCASDSQMVVMEEHLKSALVDATGRMQGQLEEHRAEEKAVAGRFRGELEFIKDELGATRVELSVLARHRDADGTDKMQLRQAFSSDLEAMRTDLRDTIQTFKIDVEQLKASSKQAQADSSAAEAGLADLQDELRASCQEVVGMVQEAKREAVSMRVELRGSVESTQSRIRRDLEEAKGEIHGQLQVARQEAREALDSSARASEQLSGPVAESLAGVQRRLADSGSVVSRAQSASESATSDVGKLQARMDASMKELRRRCDNQDANTAAAMSPRAVGRLEETLNRRVQELQIEVQSLRDSARDRGEAIEKDVRDMASNLKQELSQRCERCIEEVSASQTRRQSDGAGVADLAEIRLQLKQEFSELSRQERRASEDSMKVLHERLDAALAEMSARLASRLERTQDVAQQCACDSQLHCDAALKELRTELDLQTQAARRQVLQLSDDLHKSLTQMRSLGAVSSLRTEPLTSPSRGGQMQFTSPRSTERTTALTTEFNPSVAAVMPLPGAASQWAAAGDAKAPRKDWSLTSSPPRASSARR